jgi:hypothetical protein
MSRNHAAATEKYRNLAQVAPWLPEFERVRDAIVAETCRHGLALRWEATAAEVVAIAKAATS